MTIIAVLGFPKSGKSTWLSQQYKILLSQGKSFFVQRACPDGEGQWTFEAPNGKELRVKGKFDEQFVNWVKNSAINLNKVFDVVFLDCGGRQSPENKSILEVVDEAIIIGRTKEDLKSWENFVKSVKSIPIRFYLSYLNNNGEVNYKEVNEK
jgi:CRISPR-associated protein Csx3